MPRILLVEDNHTIAFLLRKQLEYAGYRVTVAFSPAGSETNAGTRQFDLVLINGACRNYRGWEAYHSLKGGDPESAVLLYLLEAWKAEDVKWILGAVGQVLAVGDGHPSVRRSAMETLSETTP